MVIRVDNVQVPRSGRSTVALGDEDACRLTSRRKTILRWKIYGRRVNGSEYVFSFLLWVTGGRAVRERERIELSHSFRINIAPCEVPSPF